MRQQWLQCRLLEVLEAVMTALVLEMPRQEVMRQVGGLQAGEGEQQA